MPRQCRRPGTPTELRCRERITKTTTKHVLYCIFFNEDVSAAFYTHCTYCTHINTNHWFACICVILHCHTGASTPSEQEDSNSCFAMGRCAPKTAIHELPVLYEPTPPPRDPYTICCRSGICHHPGRDHWSKAWFRMSNQGGSECLHWSGDVASRECVRHLYPNFLRRPR